MHNAASAKRQAAMVSGCMWATTNLPTLKFAPQKRVAAISEK